MDAIKTFEMTLRDWPTGTFLALITMAVVAFAVWCLFIAVDSWFQPRKFAHGTVTGKKFQPAYTQTILIYNAATKTSMPHLIFHPEQWLVSVEVAGETDSISAGRQGYDSVSKGSKVIAEYVTGRLTGGFYLKGFSKL